MGAKRFSITVVKSLYGIGMIQVPFMTENRLKCATQVYFQHHRAIYPHTALIQSGLGQNCVNAPDHSHIAYMPCKCGKQPAKVDHSNLGDFDSKTCD